MHLPVFSQQKIRHADVNVMTTAQRLLESALESMILSKVLIKGMFLIQYKLSSIDIVLGVSSITMQNILTFFSLLKKEVLFTAHLQ